jgi:hypothetical protein
MLLDILNGWFSANFVNNVVKDPKWISAFVYVNSAAMGVSVWFLLQPIWASARLSATSDKRKSVILMSIVIFLVSITAVSIPLLYNLFQNPFTRNLAEVSSNRNNEIPVTQIQSNVPDKEYNLPTAIFFAAESHPELSAKPWTRRKSINNDESLRRPACKESFTYIFF